MLRLVADSISDCIRMGIYKGDSKLFSVEKKGMALENFFGILSEVCTGANVKLADIKEFIFCEGTGSVLGIRTASVCFFSIAYITKAKVFSYKIFDIARYISLKQGLAPCQIICDSKKGFYNILDLSNGTESQAQEISYEEFESIKKPHIHYIKQRQKQILKEGFEEITYNIDDIFEAISSNTSYLEELSEVKDALLLSKREFVKWNSQADI